MKRVLLIGFTLLAAGLSSIAQAPDAKDEQAQLVALVKDVQNQQAQILSNQNKIDSKLAEVAEAVRMARLFSSRAK